VSGQEQVTLGGKIAERRRAQHLSQKQLAERILRDDGAPISPQYLNDIERDRRVPPDYLLSCFAKTLGMDLDYLVFLAGRVPPSLSFLADESEFVAFRRTGKGDPG
jgi:transcriptional regulator with XRE-family HTH domain